MDIKVVLDDGAYMPEKAHNVDAGFDIRTPIDFDVFREYTVDTGVHIEIPEGYVGFLKSKSGLNVKEGILTEGVIDSGYTGSIRVKLYHNSQFIKKKSFKAGDKITQLVILPIPEVNLIQVDKLEDTERGDNGFGSTGR